MDQANIIWTIHRLDNLILRMTQNQSTLENLPRTNRVIQMVQGHEALLREINRYLVELIELTRRGNNDSGVEADRLSQ